MEYAEKALIDAAERINAICSKAFGSDNFTASIKLAQENIEKLTKREEYILRIQEQYHWADMADNISKQLLQFEENIKKLKKPLLITESLTCFSESMLYSCKAFENIWNHDQMLKLTEAIQEKFASYSRMGSFNINDFVEEITEEYVADLPIDEPEKCDSKTTKSKKEIFDGVEKYVSFIITIISFIMGISSSIDTQVGNVYHTTIEVNNYYVNEMKMDADLLNSMSYRIINRHNVMPRLKPDCSSRVTGHLELGQVVWVSDKYKKWIEINWENEQGDSCSGWIQNYKVSSFK